MSKKRGSKKEYERNAKLYESEAIEKVANDSVVKAYFVKELLELVRTMFTPSCATTTSFTTPFWSG
jgi:hypothetical protein